MPTDPKVNGVQQRTGAPVVNASTVGEIIVVTSGDGSLRLFQPDRDPLVFNTHEGVILSMARESRYLLTGGEDGRFLRVSLKGEVEEIASFGSKWVDCVASDGEHFACSSGRVAYVWSPDRSQPVPLEHQSTVGGLAFNVGRNQLAVAHYGGVTIWTRRGIKWTKSVLTYKGFHASVTFSPNGKFVVSTMQENAVHGWRLSDNADFSMSPYPAKIKSIAWAGNTPYLVTSGASEAVCWPFKGKDGPMGKGPICVAGRKQIVSCVQGFPDVNGVLAGFHDGTVVLSQIKPESDAVVLRNATGVEVTAIAVTETGSHILIGDAEGEILWFKMQ
ncbi:MAG: WD40 repeat domain-containing protein [Pseudomonadota bacterium]